VDQQANGQANKRANAPTTEHANAPISEQRNEPATEQTKIRAGQRAVHWQKTRSLTVKLLLLWLATGFCTMFFARDLAGLELFGWPLPFYLAAQGSLLVYLGILAFYAWRMRRLDRRCQPQGRP
jgi:putative solute:sodium symporter small subunit